MIRARDKSQKIIKTKQFFNFRPRNEKIALGDPGRIARRRESLICTRHKIVISLCNFLIELSQVEKTLANGRPVRENEEELFVSVG